jgi:hypothetical protein
VFAFAPRLLSFFSVVRVLSSLSSAFTSHPATTTSFCLARQRGRVSSMMYNNYKPLHLAPAGRVVKQINTRTPPSAHGLIRS